jgi:hypothetical protein
LRQPLSNPLAHVQACRDALSRSRRVIVPTVTAAVFASGGAALATGSAGGTAHAAAAGRAQQFSIFTVTTQLNFVDLGDAGFSLGDELVFTDDVLTRRHGRRIGRDGGVCTVVRVTDASTRSGMLQCQLTFSLPGGQITVQGLRQTTGGQVPHTVERRPLTGGSGRYLGAHGEYAVRFLNNTDARVTFFISG